MVQSSSSASDHHPNLLGHLQTFQRTPQSRKSRICFGDFEENFMIPDSIGVFFYNPSLFWGLFFCDVGISIIPHKSIPLFSKVKPIVFGKILPTWSSQSNGSKQRLLVHPSRRPGLGIFRTNRGCFIWSLKRLNSLRFDAEIAKRLIRQAKQSTLT